jgi:hypothetical protein
MVKLHDGYPGSKKRVARSCNCGVGGVWAGNRKHWDVLQFCELDAFPGVAELADALDSKSSGTWYRVGSTPSSGTKFYFFLKEDSRLSEMFRLRPN